jgi:radical SAM protein with 4Fe4S-binding SPASM domain
VQITLNGADKAMHEAHVGEGHFDKTLRGIRALKKHGVVVVGCVVVTKKNASQLGDILSLWRSLDVRHVALSRFSPAGYAVADAATLLPSRSDIMQAFELAVPHGRDHGMLLNSTMPVPPCMFETGDYAPITFGYCPIGTDMQEFALGPDGQLRNCTLHKDAIGGVADILADEVDVAALTRSPDVTAYRNKLPAFCEGCIHAASCGGGCGAAAQWMLGLADDKRLPDPLLWQHVDDAFEERMEREREQPRRLKVMA